MTMPDVFLGTEKGRVVRELRPAASLTPVLRFAPTLSRRDDE
jgi:hypothetical protein